MPDKIERRVELADGAWLDMRDPDLVTNRQRRPFMRVMNRMRNGESITAAVDFQLDWAVAIAFMCIRAWSLDEELPRLFDDFQLLMEDMPAVRSDPITIAAIDYFRTEIEPPDEDEETPEEPAEPLPPKRPTK